MSTEAARSAARQCLSARAGSRTQRRCRMNTKSKSCVWLGTGVADPARMSATALPMARPRRGQVVVFGDGQARHGSGVQQLA